MQSIRGKILAVAICVAVLALGVSAALGVTALKSVGTSNADQLLLLMCETGQKNLDHDFKSVEQSVAMVSAYVEADMDGLDEAKLQAHMARVRGIFGRLISKTDGVLTYYYRIDPSISQNVKGFWYVSNDEGFFEHEVTDISQYNTLDTSALVWFTVPKTTGKPVWLPPYITDNLGKRVISYNVPIYWRGQFVGVVGIEIDYSIMAEQVESIRLFSNGYAFLNDEEGNLFFHPRIDVSEYDEQNMPVAPEGAVTKDTFMRYNYEGVEKIAAWLPLSNGMRLNVAVPVSETEGDWQRLVWNIVILAAIVLLVSCTFTMYYARRITKPLEELTEAADQADRGNYEFELNYDTDDELGRLTHTFKRLAGHMKDHISDLNKRVYVDALTSVRNKGAYSAYIEELQTRLDEEGSQRLAFGIGVFDCDNLKVINDRYGHEKGDVYLKTASRLICRVFQHSPVFRIGGDEFSVILQNEDYLNQESLAEQFSNAMTEINGSTMNQWEQVHKY
jgi:diguanylate cyclase (GGDEF)-like protein